MNGVRFRPGDTISATFELNETYEGPFTAFALLVMPNKSMRRLPSLQVGAKPVVKNMRRLKAPFSFRLLSKRIPGGAPKGRYECLVAFFDPVGPFRRDTARLLVSSFFTID
jgi:hypothetical protein